MKKSLTGRELRLLIVIGVLLLLLAVALALSLAAAARERARLEALREEESKEADRLAAGTTAITPNHLLGGFGLLGRGVTDFRIYYFGDEMMYGRGVSDELSTEVDCYRTMLKASLETYYGTVFEGRVPSAAISQTAPPDEGNGSPPLWVGDVDFDSYTQRDANFRLAILAPSQRTAEAGADGHASTGFTGDFAHDLEQTVRNMRRRAERCDILLVVPHDAGDGLAATILAVAEYYSLRTVDMRALSESLLTEDGFPSEAGHRAYADAILSEILSAAEDGHTTTGYPQNRLYN